MNVESRQQLYRIISEYTNQPVDRIKSDDRFYEDYGIDSVDVIQMAQAINQGFKIGLKTDNLKQIDTVQDLVHLIDRTEKKRGDK